MWTYTLKIEKVAKINNKNNMDLTNALDSENKQRLRIADIARITGVSAGTVDRVLHNRGRVSDEKRKKVETVINQMDYRPNVFARSLSIKKEMRFVSLIPNFEAAGYWEYIRNGINKAQKEISDHRIIIDHHYFDQYDNRSFVVETERILSALPDAVVFSPVFIEESVAFAQQLEQQHIPCVLVDSNVEAINCLAYYGQHSLKSGYTAAQLLFTGLPKDSTVLLTRSVRPNGIGSNQAILREKGFMQYVDEHKLRQSYQIVRVDLYSNDTAKNLRKLRGTAACSPPITGAVIFSSKVYRLVDFLAKVNLLGIKIIGYDELPQNIAALKAGYVSYLIAQRPEMQGYLVVKNLLKHLVYKQQTHRTNYVPVDILTREIVDEYIQFNQRLNE
ncbi:MAG: LacI family DNA-binding transcriptional regulator [Prevotellaceae bacterium]|jgi:LacI family transcriptional regulator|nr:LacI family DNA-binding transcriptional regulator [Prevotellaceae bacterium]